MLDFIVLYGAPGSGKSTLAKSLQSELKSPRINLGWLREYHLRRDWSDVSKKEERMSFENLVFILQNYKKNGYKQVIVEDLLDYMVEDFTSIFQESEFIICTLVINNDDVLKNRVLDETRDSGFRDFQQSIQWNSEMQKRSLLPGEHRIDNTFITQVQLLEKILLLIQQSRK